MIVVAFYSRHGLCNHCNAYLNSFKQIASYGPHYVDCFIKIFTIVSCVWSPMSDFVWNVLRGMLYRFVLCIDSII